MNDECSFSGPFKTFQGRRDTVRVECHFILAIWLLFSPEDSWKQCHDETSEFSPDNLRLPEGLIHLELQHPAPLLQPWQGHSGHLYLSTEHRRFQWCGSQEFSGESHEEIPSKNPGPKQHGH